MKKKQPLKERFLSHVIPEPNSGCWLWMSALFKHGYGKFGFNDRADYAHRVAWLIFKGPIHWGALVLHDCDTKPCVNPDHLHLGDHALNALEASQRGRLPYRDHRGAANSNARLDEVDVRFIRADPSSQENIARRYGITQNMVSKIKRRESWAHVT